MSWSQRVKVSHEGGYAYVPNEVLIVGWDGSQDPIMEAFGMEKVQDEGFEAGPVKVQPFQGMDPAAPVDVPSVVMRLRSVGIQAQPNHVLFADACNCCPPPPWLVSAGGLGNPLWGNAAGDGAPGANPLWGNSANANPLWGNPLWGNVASATPLWGNPLWGNPLWGNPLWGNPLWGNFGDAQQILDSGYRPSTAIPHPAPKEWKSSGAVAKTLSAEKMPFIVTLDTGFAGTDANTGEDFGPGFKPAALQGKLVDLPDVELDDGAGGKLAADGLLDPVAGHGTFIAGLIDRVQPGCRITVEDVLEPEGDADEKALVYKINALKGEGQPHILSLSLSGYSFEDMPTLRLAVADLQSRGTLIVASAGNNASCRPAYPACLPGVIGVGAIGPRGPAPFTNYGPWVDACAPGVDVVSTFFSYDGARVGTAGGPDPDNFTGWARWSGTSFSAPIVTGAIARAMVNYGLNAEDAVDRVLKDPSLMRIPNLGTVVNIV